MQQMMRTMGLVPFLFINGFLLVVAGVIITAGLHARRRAALVRSMPTSNIGMAVNGYCELEGTVAAIGGSQVIAPLTQTPCAWYHARVEKWTRGGGDRSGSWRTVKETTSSSPILLRDATGTCIVDPYLAEMTPTDKSQWTGASAVPTDRNPPRLGPTESTTPMLQVSGGPNSKFRYSEERIYVGDPLFVLGEFTARMPDDDEEDDDVEEFDDAAVEVDARDSNEDVENRDADDEGDDSDSLGPEWNDSAVADELNRRTGEVTRAYIGHGTGAKPFIVSTTAQDTHLYISDVGSQAALYMAMLPLGAVALLLYARYG